MVKIERTNEGDPAASAVRWHPSVDRSATEPISAQIVASVRSAVRDGSLRPGDRLPTNRLLARRFGVSLSTITRAMNEASRQHLVHARVGRGTFVLGTTTDAILFSTTLDGRSTVAADRAARHTIDLSSNVPARPEPDHDLREAIERVAREQGLPSAYPTPAVLAAGQAVFADLLRRRGVVVGDHQVVLAAGAQQALLATVAVIAGPRAKVLVEDLTFPGMKALVRHLGLQPVGVAMDRRGLLPDALDRAASSSGAGMLICVPSLQNPTTATMDADRRTAIATVCERRGLTVIEDDVYGALQDEPALASLLPDRTLVVTSLSKTVAPALRLGAIVGRHPQLEALRREVSLTSWTVAPAMVAIAVAWAADRTIDRRIAWQRREVTARNDLLRARWPGPDSPHRWLPTLLAPERAAAVLADAGVSVVPSTALAVTANAPKGIRLSLTAAPDRATLHLALERLEQAPVRWA